LTGSGPAAGLGRCCCCWCCAPRTGCPGGGPRRDDREEGVGRDDPDHKIFVTLPLWSIYVCIPLLPRQHTLGFSAHYGNEWWGNTAPAPANRTPIKGPRHRRGPRWALGVGRVGSLRGAAPRPVQRRWWRGRRAVRALLTPPPPLAQARLLRHVTA